MYKEFEKDITSCLSVLRGGGIILYPTDTVWGLGCDATNEAAVQKIIHLKNRPENKSFVVLVEDMDRLAQYVGPVAPQIMNIINTVTRPTTIIYPHAVDLAPSVVATDLSVAIRICRDPFCVSMIQQFNKPILSTSANISGRLAPSLFKEIEDSIIYGVDYTVKYRQEDEQSASPSTIIKWEQAAETNAGGQNVPFVIKVIRP